VVINYPLTLDDGDTLNYPLVTRTEKVRPINASVPLTRYDRKMGRVVASLIESARISFFFFSGSNSGIRRARLVGRGELGWVRGVSIFSEDIVGAGSAAAVEARANEGVNCKYRNNIRRREIRFRFSIS